MLHVCIRRFDVTGTVQNFLETKQGLISSAVDACVSGQVLTNLVFGLDVKKIW